MNRPRSRLLGSACFGVALLVMPVGPVSLTSTANAQTATVATPPPVADSADTASVSYPLNEIFLALASWSIWSRYHAAASRSLIRDRSGIGGFGFAGANFARQALAAPSSAEDPADFTVEQILDPLKVFLALIQESPISDGFCFAGCTSAALFKVPGVGTQLWPLLSGNGHFEPPMSSNTNGGWALHGDGSPGALELTKADAYSATPEPATLGLIATGLLALGIIQRRRRSVSRD